MTTFEIIKEIHEIVESQINIENDEHKLIRSAYRLIRKHSAEHAGDEHWEKFLINELRNMITPTKHNGITIPQLLIDQIPNV
jgi:hypothetical protein